MKVAMLGAPVAPRRDWLISHLSFPIETVVVPSHVESDIIPKIGDAEVIITTYFTPEMGQAAKNLKLLQMSGAGYDKIHPDSVPDGVFVCNCYEHEVGMSEWVIMMCLAWNRQLLHADREIRQFNWRMFPGAGHPPYPELRGQTMGIIGLGRIGRHLAKLAGAFQLRRIGVDIIQLSPGQVAELGLDWAGNLDKLDQLLGESDFVAILTPYLPSTKDLIGARELAKMKRTAVLANPARAEIVNQRALYEALRDRVIAGACLDPMWHYTKAGESVNPWDYPFNELDNVILTPHTAGYTDGTMENRWKVVAVNLERFVKGEPLVNIVRDLSKG